MKTALGVYLLLLVPFFARASTVCQVTDTSSNKLIYGTALSEEEGPQTTEFAFVGKNKKVVGMTRDQFLAIKSGRQLVGDVYFTFQHEGSGIFQINSGTVSGFNKKVSLKSHATAIGAISSLGLILMNDENKLSANCFSALIFPRKIGHEI